MSTRTVSVNLVANIGQYVSGMNTAAGATMRLGDTAQTNSKKAQSGFDLAGKGALIMGAAVVGGFAMAVGASMKFEKAMSGAAAATTATGGALGDLRDAAMQAGADTAYSATEAAGAITEMGKAGVSTADILDGGLNGALALAAAGQLEVGKAAEIAATAMTQFSLSGDDLPHVADLLAAGAGKAMGSVEDLGMALNQAGLVASGAGLSIEETTGTLAAFASAGLVGSDAGTSLRSALLHLQNATGPAKETMDEYGISLYDAQGEFVGMSALAGQLQEKMGGLTPAVRDAAMAQIFGSDAVRAANVLYKEGAAGIADWTVKVNDAGYAADTAAKLQDNLAGDLEKLGGSFETLMITMGEGAQGPLRSLVQGLGGVVDGITWLVEAWQSLPGPVQTAIVMLGAVAALKGPVSTAMETIGLRALYLKDSLAGASLSMSGMKSAGSGLLGMVGGPWGVAMIGAAVAVAAISSAISDANQQTKGWTQALLEGGAAARQARADMEAQRNNTDDFAIIGQWIGENLGLVDSLEDVTRAAREQWEAMSPLEQAQAKVSEWTAELASRMDTLGRSHEDTRVAQERLAYWSGVLGEKESFLAAATDTVAAASAGGASAQDQFAAATEAAKEQVDAAKQAVDDFKLSLDILTGAHVSMIQVESAFEAAVADADGALKNMTGSVLNASGGLNMQSEAGRAAADVLLDVRDSGNQLISTMLQQGATAEQVSAKDAQLRTSFIRSAEQMGINRRAAEVLADQILGIPAERETKITADTAQANAAVAATQAQIDNMRGRILTIEVRANMPDLNGVVSGSGRMGTFAEGGYTGPGGKYQPAGIVHAGEFVVPQHRVNALGGPGAVGALVGMPGYAAGGAVLPLKVDVNADSFTGSMNTFIARAREAARISAATGVGTANGVGGLGPAAARAHAFVRSNWGFGGTIGGYANRNIAGTNTPSKHSMGKAIDVMIGRNMGLGQSIADYFSGPGRGPFGVDNVIWNRRINSGRGWTGYSGVSPHTDHPHIDFYKTGTSYVPHDGPAILHKGEAVIPAEVNAAMRSREFSGGGRSGGAGNVTVAPPQVTVHFHVDGQEFRGMTRTEIDGRLEDLYRQTVRR